MNESINGQPNQSINEVEPMNRLIDDTLKQKFDEESTLLKQKLVEAHQESSLLKLKLDEAHQESRNLISKVNELKERLNAIRGRFGVSI